MAQNKGENKADEDIRYLLYCISTASDFSMNFTDVAKKSGFANGSNANRKFKEIAKHYGYKYTKGVGLEALDPASIPSTPTSRAKIIPMKRKKAKTEDRKDQQEVDLTNDES